MMLINRSSLSPLILCVCFIAFPCCAEDWPNWRGPNRNGISVEQDWSHDWPGNGPDVLWKASVGAGFASFAVADGRVYTTGNTGVDKKLGKKEQQDIIYCLDAGSGKEIWKHKYSEPLMPKYYDGGTSATPTLHEGRLFSISKSGKVFCLEAESGKVIWKTDLAEKPGVKPPTWGFAGSPLAFKDMIILNAGTHGLALRQKDGSVAWSTGPEKAGYSTPVQYVLEGKTYVTMLGENTLAAVEAGTGATAWVIKWKALHDENIADPVIIGEKMLVSSHLGKRCSYFSIRPDGLDEIWTHKELRAWMSTPVAWKGHAYAMDAQTHSLMCVELKTGKVTWTRRNYGLGHLILAGGRLIVLTDKGRLVIVDAVPDEYKELAACQAGEGKYWTDPVLSGGKIYIRSWAGEVKCLDVKLKK